MNIQLLNAVALSEFIASETFQDLEFLPISTHRALSHIRNPQVDDADILMVLAMSDKDELMGYLGVIPDRFYFGDQPHKIGWMSCIWVNSKVRVRGLANRLLEEALKAWDYNIVATGFTPTAKKLYDRSGAFVDFGYKQGIRGYLRFNVSELLPIIKPGTQKFRPLLRIADSGLNIVNDFRLRLMLPALAAKKGRVQYVNRVDSETATFILPFLQGQLSRRNAEDLNWLLQNPWILPQTKRTNEADRYYFSSFDHHFAFSAIKIFDPQNTLVAFVILATRNKMLKVPYLYTQNKNLPMVVAAITKHMFTQKLYTITVHNEQLSRYLKENRTPFLYKKRHEKAYIISKKFSKLIDNNLNLLIQDGDGDGAFT